MDQEPVIFRVVEIIRDENCSSALIELNGTKPWMRNLKSRMTYRVTKGWVRFEFGEGGDPAEFEAGGYMIIEVGTLHRVIGESAQLIELSEPTFDPSAVEHPEVQA